MTAPYAIQLDIPIRLWQTTTDRDGVDERRRKRAALRRLARAHWRRARDAGAPRVGRYVLVVTVAGRRESPVLACETLKPIIDAGTDEHMWPDDDPFHRILTCYMRDPLPASGNRPRVSVMVIPVGPRILPPRCILSLLPDARGAIVGQTIPERDWLTSNMRLDPGERDRRQTAVMNRSRPEWERIRMPGGCCVLCGVRYPDSRDEWQGDPDNTAETATALWGAGALLGRAPAEPDCFMFYLLDGQAAPGTHDMMLLTVETPQGFGWPTALVGLASR